MPTKKTTSTKQSSAAKPPDVQAGEAYHHVYNRLPASEKRAIDEGLAKAQREAQAFVEYLRSPEAAAAKEAWEAEYGVEWPGDLKAWERLCVRAGLPIGHFLKGDVVPADVRAGIEGYLLRVKDSQRSRSIRNDTVLLPLEMLCNESHGDGPVEPKRFCFNGIAHELNIEPRSFELLKLVWAAWKSEEGKLPVATAGAKLWNNRATPYDTIAPHVSKANTAMVACGLDFTIAKNRGSDYITLTVPRGYELRKDCGL